MRKIGKYFYCLLIFNTMALAKLISSEKIIPNEEQIAHPSLKEFLSNKIREVIEESQEIPGFTKIEFAGVKENISKTWNKLFREGVLEITGTDKEIRPSFVALQAVIEHVLSIELQKSIKTLSGFIHTPTPSTALCTKGEISPELVDHSIEIDPNRLLTIKARATIIRDYLLQGGNLYVIYPQSGLLKRSLEQQKIYKEALANYSSHLFDIPLHVDSIPLKLTGATYLFRDHSDNLFVFGIKMTQANHPQDTGSFGLWFGSIDQPAIQGRVNSLAQFFENNGFDLFKKRAEKPNK